MKYSALDLALRVRCLALALALRLEYLYLALALTLVLINSMHWVYMPRGGGERDGYVLSVRKHKPTVRRIGRTGSSTSPTTWKTTESTTGRHDTVDRGRIIIRQILWPPSE